ncbi:mechanosensitive ion channel family protein [Allohahella sp. A8]|uniref:mechanosensitive ion channel family protein n=1 Tax=Allohahella sp. A8 TaxID=3141461 RepID=UPI0026CE68EB|tara:strand:+ start:12703 stop:13608 length:906 start_codon:yes stop_codon:yes gene_type:complete
MNINIAPLKIIREQIEAFTTSFIAVLPNLLAAVLFLVVVWLANKLIGSIYSRVLARTHMRSSLKAALQSLVSVAVWTFGLLIAATIAMPGLTPTKLLAGLGLGSIAIGLAFKDIFENFLAGILILLREPMRIGDYIEVEGISGEVKKITLRDTYLRQVDGDLILLPNSVLYKNAVSVHTDWDRKRVTIIVGIAYDEDVAEGRRVIEAALKDLDTVDQQRPVEIFAQAFNSSSIDFEVTWWTGSRPVEIRRSKDKVVEAVKTALDEAGIEIPFPYRTLTFKDPLALRSSSNDEDPSQGVENT